MKPELPEAHTSPPRRPQPGTLLPPHYLLFWMFCYEHMMLLEAKREGFKGSRKLGDRPSAAPQIAHLHPQWPRR